MRLPPTTLEDAVKNAEDAKRCWLKAAVRDGVKIPEPKPNDSYSGQFRLRMPKELHRDLAKKAREQGVSMNQYCVYVLSKSIADPFYSDENIERLKKAIKQIEETGGTVHDISSYK